MDTFLCLLNNFCVEKLHRLYRDTNLDGIVQPLEAQFFDSDISCRDGRQEYLEGCLTGAIIRAEGQNE
jgi:hypothetical protein